MRKFFLLIILFFSSFFIKAQNNSQNTERLKVFIDCKSWSCPFDFIRSEIKFVDFVNDRFSANVFILLTSVTTGAGGQEYKIYFEGLEKFKSLTDTLVYIRTSVDTEDEDRRKMVQSLKLGLIRYLSKTSLATSIQISVPTASGDEKKEDASKKDKWDSWVFNTGINGNFSGSDNYTSSNVRLRFNAARVTEKLKLRFSTNYSKAKDKYIYTEYDSLGAITYSDTTRSVNKRSNIDGSAAFSINDHWSAGIFSSYYSSTFSNINKSISAKLALEYSVYPYKTFNTKYIGFLYRVGPVFNDYSEITWRNKSNEWLLQQSLSFDVSFTQKWGSVYSSMYWSNYFFDWNWNNYGFFGNGEFRIVKGLTVNFFGGFSLIHDQVELPKGNATQTQVLIRQRVLRNSFEYFTGIGLNYRFGSIYNNVVNPRLGEAGGGFFF